MGQATATPTWMRTAEESGFLRGKNRITEEMRKRTDIAPHWCPIRSIPAPYNGVYEVGETSKGRPNHVQTSPHILGLQMPGQGDE